MTVRRVEEIKRIDTWLVSSIATEFGRNLVAWFRKRILQNIFYQECKILWKKGISYYTIYQSSFNLKSL